MGLALIALDSLVFIILTLIDGEVGTLVFFIISIVLSVIFAALVWRFERWALVLTALWGIPNLWGPLFLYDGFLSYLDSFFDFVLPLLLTVGVTSRQVV